MSAAEREHAEWPTELADALAAVLRPLAQLCVAQGLPLADVEERLKSAYIEAAKAGVPDTSRRVSRISTTTGINRREVSRLLGIQPRPASSKTRSRPVAAEVFAQRTTSREFRDRRGAPRRRGSVQGSTLSDVMPREKDSWRPVGGPNPTKISRDRVVP